MGLLVLTLLGQPNIVRHSEMPLDQCRQVAPMLTEPGRVHARCIILPSRGSFGHRSPEPRQGWAGP